MFSLKQLSTIKKVLNEETKIKEEEENLEKSDLDYKSFNLILATDRLQEIYKEVCTTHDLQTPPSSSETLELLEEISEKEPKKVIFELFNSNKFLSCKLNEAYKTISELKENVSTRYIPKIKRLEAEMKKHSMLEETWQKSRDALIQENKILLKQVNKNEHRIKGIRKIAEKKMKRKFENFKKKLSQSTKFDKIDKRNLKGDYGCPGEVKGEMIRSSSELKRNKRRGLSKAKSTKSGLKTHNQFSDRIGSSSKLLKRVYSEKKLLEEKEKNIKNLKFKICELEKKRKEELKRKLSEAFDRFEEEKKKIIEFFQNDKKMIEEENEKLNLKLIDKERIVVKIEEERILEKREFEKHMLDLEEEKHQFEIDRGKNNF